MEVYTLLSKKNGPDAERNMWNIIYCLLKKTGSALNPNNIKELLEDDGIYISAQTVRLYLQKLVKENLFIKLERISLNSSDREDPLLKYTGAYYISDINDFYNACEQASKFVDPLSLVSPKFLEEAYFRTQIFHLLAKKYDNVYIGKMIKYTKINRITAKIMTTVDFVCENEDGFRSYYICCDKSQSAYSEKLLITIPDSMPKNIVLINKSEGKWLPSGIWISDIEKIK